MIYKARIKFFDAADGGRKTPPSSGYMPHLKIGKEFTSCKISKILKDHDDIMDFNIEHFVNIELLFESQYPDKTFLNEEIRLFEGAKLVGTGKFIFD